MEQAPLVSPDEIEVVWAHIGLTPGNVTVAQVMVKMVMNKKFTSGASRWLSRLRV